MHHECFTSAMRHGRKTLKLTEMIENTIHNTQRSMKKAILRIEVIMNKENLERDMIEGS